MKILLGLDAKKQIILPLDAEMAQDELENIEIMEDGCMVYFHPKLEIQYVVE